MYSNLGTAEAFVIVHCRGLHTTVWAHRRLGDNRVAGFGCRGLRLTMFQDMTTILVMSDRTLPLAEIKKRLSEVVDGVEERHDRVVLTRNGRPAAVILSPDDLESLEESLEILSNPKAMREIRRAEAEIDRGKALTADELRAKYLEQ